MELSDERTFMIKKDRVNAFAGANDNPTEVTVKPILQKNMLFI